jgi:hypothetical protein
MKNTKNTKTPRLDAAWRDGWRDAYLGGDGRNPYRYSDDPNSCHQHFKAGWYQGAEDYDLGR